MFERLARVIEGIGVCLLFLGVAAMDSPSVFAPLVMIFGGLGIALAGYGMEVRL